MTIKAIETRYKGYRFRSRLEARWAVFFDALGIEYQYEPQGFEIRSWDWPEDGEDSQPETIWRYLPDFYLPKLGTWVEVKGSLEDVAADYFEMIAWAIDWGGCLPGVSDSFGSSYGLLWLGPIPEPHYRYDDIWLPTHWLLQHSKGGWFSQMRFEVGGMHNFGPARDYFDATWGDAGCHIRESLLERVYGKQDYWAFPSSFAAPIADAYTAARSARFEHGETPRV